MEQCSFLISKISTSLFLIRNYHSIFALNDHITLIFFAYHENIQHVISKQKWIQSPGWFVLGYELR
ncbi:hypothetical protein LLB_1925 [Legionella longbeachae D-4968]|nr:hypothetical protein LLB_1925 [Legionella longbeachae D-4968]